jgi:hypothetical protein
MYTLLVFWFSVIFLVFGYFFGFRPVLRLLAPRPPLPGSRASAVGKHDAAHGRCAERARKKLEKATSL